MEGSPIDASFDAVPARAVGSLDEVSLSNGIDRELCDRENLTIGGDASLVLRGWAADSLGTKRAHELLVLLDGVPVRARYGYARSDVAAAFHRTQMRDTGFRAVIATSELAPGEHRLQIATRDASHEPPLELASFVFLLDATKTTHALRENTPGLFMAEITSFSAENAPPSLDARIERDFIAVVRGRLRESGSGARPATVYGVVDGFDGGFGQLGLRAPDGSSDGFLLCFPTHDLAYGKHDLDLFATDRRGRLELVARLPFSVVPICCAASVTIPASEIAPARVEWVGAGSRAPVGFLRGWAVDPVTGDSIGKAYLAFEDGRRIALFTRQFRDDLEGVDCTRAPFCGFTGAIAFGDFAPGRHVARVIVESKDGTRSHETDASLEFTL